MKLLLRSSLLLLFATCSANAAEFSGINPGATLRVNVPLNAIQQRYVSEGGNAVPPHAVAVLAVPPGFATGKSWPVLVTLSTSDFKRQNRDDLVNFYRQSAFAEGWVLLAGDGPQPARNDTAGWRAGMTLAALDALHRSFPGSAKWPVAVAGFSGGAKRAGTVAPLLALAGARISGIFLSGLNEDRLSEGYRKFQPGAAFLRTPIFLSSGRADKIAPLTDQQQVRLSMQKTGFTNVRQEVFPEGHAVKRTHIRSALRWFLL
ncbi:hypothetical protein BH20VER2_BH20VER2_08070 [soil metagenome]